jgi:hypothetical protein
MPSLRTLVLALFVSSPVLLSDCSSSKDDPKPTPVQPTAEYGAVIGYADPIAALTSVTATAADGTIYPAVINTSGSYVFGKLPVGNYTLSYTAATGYVAPASQTITVIVNYTLNLPALTVQPVVPPGRELLTRPNWRITALTEATTDASGNTTTTDIFALTPACERDNFWKFNLTNQYVIDEGPTTCGSNSPQTTTDSWTLSSDEKELQLSLYGAAQIFSVKTLSSTTLELTSTSVSNGTTTLSTVTFTAF